MVDPILDSVKETGGGWPVLVLVIVIGVITYLVSRWMDRQAKITEQRITDRKMEFEATLERERQNSERIEGLLKEVVRVVRDNSSVMAEFSSILRPMSETLSRIDRHIIQQGFESRQHKDSA